MPVEAISLNRGQDWLMSDTHFSNVDLKDDTEYFLYIGELKNYGLNIFLKEALARIFNRPFDFIAVVPDVFEQYNYDNLIVINPLSKTYACTYGAKVSCRVSARSFMASVSADRQVRALIKRLLNRQKRLYLYMYESLPEMTLDEIEGVVLLGPDKRVARRINSKIYQYTRLKDIVPLVEFAVCADSTELLSKTARLWRQWDQGIFITQEYSAAGVNAVIAGKEADIPARFREETGRYLISRYIPHDNDPTVLAVVANEEDVYVVGTADQRIEGGARFTGSTFPSVLPAEMVETLASYTRKLGQWLGREGYRGIFGCDFLVTEDGDIRFLEINARKQGTTLEFCCTLEQSLPVGSPMLPELEYYAVEEDVLPVNAREMAGNPRNLHWSTYNYKLHSSVRTDGYIPQGVGEREAFKRVAGGNLKKDFLILEHTGSDFIVAQGAFIARIVALGHDHQSVAQGLKQGLRTIDLTIAEKLDPEIGYENKTDRRIDAGGKRRG